jgi:hypothetical protein
MRLGRYSANPGTASMMRIRVASQIRNGKAAAATRYSDVPLGATPSITWSNDPKGAFVSALP